MKASDYRFTVDGVTVRVVIAGDVIALPDERWAMGNFGAHISQEWLLDSGCLPGTKAHRARLATIIRRALAAHHGGTP